MHNLRKGLEVIHCKWLINLSQRLSVAKVMRLYTFIVKMCTYKQTNLMQKLWIQTEKSKQEHTNMRKEL